MCAGICADICADICTDVCADICTDIGTDICRDTHIHMCWACATHRWQPLTEAVSSSYRHAHNRLDMPVAMPMNNARVSGPVDGGMPRRDRACEYSVSCDTAHRHHCLGQQRPRPSAHLFFLGACRQRTPRGCDGLAKLSMETCPLNTPHFAGRAFNTR